MTPLFGWNEKKNFISIQKINFRSFFKTLFSVHLSKCQQKKMHNLSEIKAKTGYPND